MRARLALEQLAGLVSVDGSAFAAGANGLALRGRPADQLEGLVSLIVRKARDFRQTERPRLC